MSTSSEPAAIFHSSEVEANVDRRDLPDKRVEGESSSLSTCPSHQMKQRPVFFLSAFLLAALSAVQLLSRPFNLFFLLSHAVVVSKSASRHWKLLLAL